jgi:hypothetical protein
MPIEVKASVTAEGAMVLKVTLRFTAAREAVSEFRNRYHSLSCFSCQPATAKIFPAGRSANLFLHENSAGAS